MDEDSCVDVGIGAAGLIMAACLSYVKSLSPQPASHSPVKAGPFQGPTTDSRVLDEDYLEQRKDRADSRYLAPSRRPRRPVRGSFRGTPGISFLGVQQERAAHGGGLDEGGSPRTAVCPRIRHGSSLRLICPVAERPRSTASPGALQPSQAGHSPPASWLERTDLPDCDQLANRRRS